METKPIIIVSGEPNSIFYEIFFKCLKDNKFKSPLLLITSIKLFKIQMRKFKFKGNIKIINSKNLRILKDNKSINIIDVNYKSKEILNALNKVSSKIFLNRIKNIKNPYGDGKSSKRIINIIKELDLKNFNTQKKLTY